MLRDDLQTLLNYVNDDGREFSDYLDCIHEEYPENEQKRDQMINKAIRTKGRAHIFCTIARLWEYLDGNPSKILPKNYSRD